VNKVWLECVYDFRGFEEEPKIVNKVATIAQPLTNEVLEGLAAQLSQKQQQAREKP
jgi:hypothetical protein